MDTAHPPPTAAQTDRQGHPREDEALGWDSVLSVRGLQKQVQTTQQGPTAGDRCWEGGEGDSGRMQGEVVREAPGEADVAHYGTDEPSVGGDPHTRRLRGRPRGHLPALRSISGPPETRAGQGSECRELLSQDLWEPHTGEPHSWRWDCRQLAGLSPAKGLPLAHVTQMWTWKIRADHILQTFVVIFK